MNLIDPDQHDRITCMEMACNYAYSRIHEILQTRRKLNRGVVLAWFFQEPIPTEQGVVKPWGYRYVGKQRIRGWNR